MVLIKCEVQSSMLKYFEYDDSTKTLKTTFNNNDIYEYNDVPLKNIIEMIESESKGKYFAANIKNVFKYKKI